MSAVKILKEDPCSPDFKPLEEAMRAWEMRRSNPKESHRIAAQLIDHALEFDQPLVTAWAYLTCGAHEVGANELDDAEESLGAAKKLFLRAGNHRGESLTLILRARVDMGRGELRSALELYKSIIEREAHGLQTLERFEAFNSIAGCFWGLDNVELCLLYLTKAFDSLRNSSYNTERATVLSNMGAALMAVGNFEAACEFLEASTKFTRGGTDRILELNTLSNLAACYIELRNVPEVTKVSARILTDYQDIAFSPPTNNALCNAVMGFALAKRWVLAEQCLVGAQIIAHESQLPTNQVNVSLAQAFLSECREQWAVAAAMAESVLTCHAAALTDETRSQLYSLLISCYQRLSRVVDLIATKRLKLELNERRYSSGLAAAMVILDLKSSLRRAGV